MEGGQSFADAVTAAGGQVQGVQCIDATQIAVESASAEPGDVLGPFGGESGIVVVQLQETRPGEYDDLAEALLAQVNQQFSEAARTELLDSLGAIDVSVDPRFGTWQPDQLTVAAPQGPSTPPSTTLPTP